MSNGHSVDYDRRYIKNFVTELKKLDTIGLKNINDKPVCFYIKGNKNILDKESVGIVGSRNAFKTSLDFTKEISKRISSKRNKYNKWFSKRN